MARRPEEENKSSSVRLAILAAASRVCYAALHELEWQSKASRKRKGSKQSSDSNNCQRDKYCDGDCPMDLEGGTTKRDGVNLGKRRRCFSFKLIVPRLIFQIIAYSSNATRVIREGAAHLNKRDTTPPLAWLWRIRGAYTSAWFNSCNALHVYAVKSRMRVQTQCGQGRNEASEIKYVTFRLTTEEYTQIENRGCLSAATPFDCVSRRILNDPKMRLGSRILEQKYLRVAGSSTPISRLLIMKPETGSSKNRYSNGCSAQQPSTMGDPSAERLPEATYPTHVAVGTETFRP